MAGRIPKVVVVGPAYVDMTVKCSEVPISGEMVEGSGFLFAPVGGGHNSAIAASLCGCNVYLISKVGDDIFGCLIRDSLSSHGVNTDYVFTAPAMSTGVNLTMVNSTGENTGCVSHGANRALSSDELGFASVEQLISTADICLIRGNLGEETIKMAIRTASLYKRLVALEVSLDIHDTSEIDNIKWPGEYYLVDILIPNLRASGIAAEVTAGAAHNVKLIGSELVARGVGCVVLKTGSRGCFLFDRDGVTSVAGFGCEHVMNATRCDDAFAGAFAASLGAGDEVRDAVKFASAAGAVASRKFGSQSTMPSKEEIIELLQNESD